MRTSGRRSRRRSPPGPTGDTFSCACPHLHHVQVVADGAEDDADQELLVHVHENPPFAPPVATNLNPAFFKPHRPAPARSRMIARWVGTASAFSIGWPAASASLET